LRSFLTMLQMTLLLATSVQAAAPDATFHFTTPGGEYSTVQLLAGSNVGNLLAHIRGEQNLPNYVGSLVVGIRILIPTEILEPRTDYTFVNVDHLAKLKHMLTEKVRQSNRLDTQTERCLQSIERLSGRVEMDQFSRILLRQEFNEYYKLFLAFRGQEFLLWTDSFGRMATFQDPNEVQDVIKTVRELDVETAVLLDIQTMIDLQNQV